MWKIAPQPKPTKPHEFIERFGRFLFPAWVNMNIKQLWLNQSGLRFTEAALEWGVAVDEHGNVKAGMGVAARPKGVTSIACYVYT